MVATNGDGKGAVIVNGYCDLFPVCVCECVFRHFFRGEGGIFTPKTYNCPPPKRLSKCVLKIFFSAGATSYRDISRKLSFSGK